MIPVVIAAIVAFVVIGFILARSASSRKKQAVESLQAEKEAVGAYSILDLVTDEVDDLGLRSISGAEAIPPDVLLKVWKDAEPVRGNTDKDHLAYEVAEGVTPVDATAEDVTLTVLK
jgi:hypothetical protein